jgi:hypothetical protein
MKYFFRTRQGVGDKTWLELEFEKDKDNELDKNQDGLLDRREIISWVLPSNE